MTTKSELLSLRKFHLRKLWSWEKHSTLHQMLVDVLAVPGLLEHFKRKSVWDVLRNIQVLRGHIYSEIHLTSSETIINVHKTCIQHLINCQPVQREFSIPNCVTGVLNYLNWWKTIAIFFYFKWLLLLKFNTSCPQRLFNRHKQI